MKFLKSYQGIMKVVLGTSNKLIFRWEGKQTLIDQTFWVNFFPNFEIIMKYVLSHLFLEVDVI
jgi:hypothetical protein